ncbi:DUF2975 domain-containing protein [Kineosporia sp. A_224]|uniref:DUF2975 domain-containing protein n=1 Tax=Kineosporia sp. A_224 TaxID=1962180 RepID=UPI000B4AA496|nr:DUF2975 domain-containing protein [Kineosporia sp. A_224]
MTTPRPRRALRLLQGAATTVHVAALCLAVAVLVIAFVPGSSVTVDLPAHLFSTPAAVTGTTPGVTLDPAGQLAFVLADPTTVQRLLRATTVVPGLLVVAEVARRLADLLRSARQHDPFTAQTVRRLTTVAKIAAVGGSATWLLGVVAAWVLVSTVVDPQVTVEPSGGLVGWLAVGLVVAGFAQLVDRGVDLRTELDTVI